MITRITVTNSTTTTRLSAVEAKAAGYQALTHRYRLPKERRMLEGVLADMRRGNVSYVLVKDRLGFSVWRKGMLSDAEFKALAGGHHAEALAGSHHASLPRQRRWGNWR